MVIFYVSALWHQLVQMCHHRHRHELINLCLSYTHHSVRRKMGAAHSVRVQTGAEKGSVSKSYRKEATFELGLKRRVREGWARRAECGHGGDRQTETGLNRPNDPAASFPPTC